MHTINCQHFYYSKSSDIQLETDLKYEAFLCIMIVNSSTVKAEIFVSKIFDGLNIWKFDEMTACGSTPHLALPVTETKIPFWENRP